MGATTNLLRPATSHRPETNAALVSSTAILVSILSSSSWHSVAFHLALVSIPLPAVVRAIPRNSTSWISPLYWWPPRFHD